jgi:hypothetical protein
MAGLYNLMQNFPTRHFEITPDDDTPLARRCLVYANDSGNVAIEDMDGEVITYTLAAGEVAPVVAVRVHATGTTATDLIGLWR